MLFFDKCEYSEFMQSEEGISTNILANRLKALVANGICTRRKHPTDGKKILYELTEMGADLKTLILNLAVWGDKHLGRARISPIIKEHMQFRNGGYPNGSARS